MTYLDKYPGCTECPVYHICSDSRANSQVICEGMKDPDVLSQEWDEYLEAWESYYGEHLY